MSKEKTYKSVNQSGISKNNESYQRGTLVKIIQILSSSLDYQYILDNITSLILELLDSKGATIYLIDNDKKYLIPVKTSDPNNAEEVMSNDIIINKSLSGKVVKAKKGMIFKNAALNADAYQIPGTAADEDEHLIIFPLLIQNEVLGTLNLYRRHKLYKKEDLDFGEVFALYAGMAIQNAKEHKQLMQEINERKQAEINLKQQSKDQVTLLDATKSLTTSLEIEKVLQNISDRSTQLVGLDTGAIYLINGEELYLGAATPTIPQDFPEVFRLARLVEHPNIQKAISNRKPHILPDLMVANLSTAEQAIRDSRNMRSLIYVPLMIKKKAIGVLILGTVKETRTFSKQEIDLYITFSHLAALSIQNAHLFNKTKQNVIELKQRIKERKQAQEKLINRNKELELYNEVTVDRELFMLNLKKEINELLEKSGEKPKYEIPI